MMLPNWLVALILADALGAPSPPQAHTFTPIQHFDGLDHEGQVLQPTADEVVILARWFRHSGSRVSLAAGGNHLDQTLPRCDFHSCARLGSLVVTTRDQGDDTHVLESQQAGLPHTPWTHNLGPANVLSVTAVGTGIQVLLSTPRSATAEELLGFDAEGTALWRVVPPADALPEIWPAGEELVVLTPDEAHIIEAATGVTHQVLDIPGGEIEMAAATPKTLVVSRGHQRARLLRIKRSDGSVAWSKRTTTTALKVVDDMVLACTAGGSVVTRALDNGRLQWSYGLGFRCTSVWSVPVAPDQPARMMAAGPNGRFVVFEADPSPAPLERYAVRGRVLVDRRPQRGVRVHVGDRWARTNEHGRYEVRARGRGTLRIWVELPDSAVGRGRVLNWEPRATVELSGVHSYRRDLVTDTGMDDH